MAPDPRAQRRPDPDEPTQVFAVLGIPLRVEAIGGVVAAAVADACGDWRAAAFGSGLPLRLHIAANPRLFGSGAVDIEVKDNGLFLSGAGARGHADAQNHSASCAISPEFLAAPETLREQVIDPLVLFLATRNGRVPLHASAFAMDGLAVLLAGPSGAGKSCLALAADRAGFEVLSDDTVYVQQSPEFGIWGMPRAAHLLPGDCERATEWRQRLRSGRVKNVVPLRSAALGGGRYCGRATLCVLAKGAEPKLRRLEPIEALARLDPVDPGFTLMRGAIIEASTTLAANGAWELTLSSDPSAAIELLRESLPLLLQTAVS